MSEHPKTWTTCNTSELIDRGLLEIGDGYRAKNSEMGNSGLPFIRISNVTNCIDFESADILSTESVKKAGSKISLPFDVLLTTKGSVGRCIFVKSNQRQFVYSPQLSYWRVKDYSSINPRFLYYWLQSSEYHDQAQKVKGSTDMADYVSLTEQRRMDITLPPVDNQNRIAHVLSAYDDLFDNNQLRMQILEKMAKAIFREWFVRFRFPKHEDFKMVDSELGTIPEGWIVAEIGKVLSTLESGSRPRGGIDPSEKDVPSAGAENILGLGQYDYSKEKFVSREFFEKMKKGHVKDGDVLLYKDGASLGRKSMFRDKFPHEELCINEHVFILRTNDICTQSYLYFWLDLPDVTQQIINLNSNAAQPGISQSGVKSLQILIPDIYTLNSYDSFTERILSLLFRLARMNKLLEEMRDMLLPKLVSGEIDVSELDIETSSIIVHKTPKYEDAQSDFTQWLDGDEDDD